MGCCNDPVTSLTGLPADPAQHVNYERGMVLGVDDFRQEFAYHSGRQRWLARDTVGYGTLSGLRVMFQSGGTEGPQLHVSSGSALSPGGHLICVPSDQCAILNRWLTKAENAAMVLGQVAPGSPATLDPPPAGASGEVLLYLVLCHDECLSGLAPIPGEPCRSEDELMKPSRVVDDFRLELREAPPAQVEEDAVQDFLQWLRDSIVVVDTSPPPLGDEANWIAILRDAARPWLDAEGAPQPVAFASLADYLATRSPGAVMLATDQVHGFLRTALRFWITELRPLWTAMRCHRPQQPDVDCLLLARVGFQVTWIGGAPSGSWQLTGDAGTMTVDESARALLAHQSVLQAWLLNGPIGTQACAMPRASEPAPRAQPDFMHEARPGFAPFMRGGAGALRVPVMRTDTDLVLDDGHYIIIAGQAASLAITLPASTAMTAGQVYVIRNAGVESLRLICPGARGGDAGPTCRIDGSASVSIRKKHALTVVADGTGQWHSIATT